MYGSVKKETFEIKRFQISPETIRSIKTVEDTVKTEEERERAALKWVQSINFLKMLQKIDKQLLHLFLILLLRLKTLRIKTDDIEPEEPQEIQKNY